MGFQHMSKERLQALRRLHPGGAKPKASSLRKLTDLEAAWLGAFVEADGCVFVRTFTDGQQPKPHVVISQREVAPVATALRLTQVGYVQYQTHYPNPMWVWTVSRLNDAHALLVQLAPYSWKVQNLLEGGG